MGEISGTAIESVLSIYKPAQRLLQSASIAYPKIQGTFFIGPTYYSIQPFQHATDIEIQLCLNQLSYVALSELIKDGPIAPLHGLDFEALQHEGMFIRESRKKFSKKISTDRPITGELIVQEFRDYGEIIRGFVDFQFENRSCVGNLDLVVIRGNYSQGDRK